MLPRPFVNYIPTFLNRNDTLLALANKIDEHLDEWQQDVLDLNTIIDPARMPVSILDDVGQYLTAGILSSDSERVKREKIWNAIQSHQLRGTFQFDIKPTIDTITGLDASIFSGFDNSDFIVLGNEAADPDVFWATMGIDSVDDNLGIDMVGAGDELVLAGTILIDLGGLFNDIAALELATVDKIPVYFNVVFGYVVNNEFIALPISGILATEDNRRLTTEDERTFVLE